MCNLSCSTVVSLKGHKRTKYFWSKLTLIQNNWLCSQSLLWLLTLGHLTITQTATWHCILNTETLIRSRSLLAAITAFTPLGRYFTRFWSISVGLRASVPVYPKGVGWPWKPILWSSCRTVIQSQYHTWIYWAPQNNLFFTNVCNCRLHGQVLDFIHLG